ncbi:hypothetical protein SEVIR_9G096600v4 [Setaria viridis]|nr:hypothetical protein SETIT_9G098400v2 [Setaria italica]
METYLICACLLLSCINTRSKLDIREDWRRASPHHFPMALVKKKKGAGAVLLAAALTAAILLPAASVYSSSVMSSRSRPHARYRTYIVYLRKPQNADAMADEDAHRRWHESFLPSTLTDSGEPRLLRSFYRYGIYGFTARLTVAEHAVVAKKPGFVSSRQLLRRTRDALHWVPSRQGADRKVATSFEIARIVQRFLM